MQDVLLDTRIDYGMDLREERKNTWAGRPDQGRGSAKGYPGVAFAWLRAQ